MFEEMNNFFTGSVDMQSVPKSLKRVKVMTNRLAGPFLLNPETNVEVIYALHNHFDANFNIADLPRGFRAFEHQSSGSRGTFDISALPQTLVYLDVMNNAFSGSLCFHSLPRGVIYPRSPICSLKVLRNNKWKQVWRNGKRLESVEEFKSVE